MHWTNFIPVIFTVVFIVFSPQTVYFLFLHIKISHEYEVDIYVDP